MLMSSNYPNDNESGFVTVLMVLLIGMAIAASAVGTAYYVNSSQKSLVSGHALTNVKSGAWTGVEAFRQYLENLSEADLQALDGQTEIQLKISETRKLKISNLSVSSASTGDSTYLVTANIHNTSAAAKASATIQAVYQVSFNTDDTTDDGTSGSTVTFPNAMNFYGNLDANGGIKFANGEQKAVVSVAGDFSTDSGLDGIGELRTTGNVDIGGGSARGLENIYTNGNVDLNASGNYALVSAKGTVSTSGSVAVDNIYADQDVTLKSSGKFNSVDTKGSITMSGNSSAVSTIAGQNITVSNGTIDNALANSNIEYSVWNAIKTAKSGGMFTCKNKNWKDYGTISAIAFSSCPTDANSFIKLPVGTIVASPKGALVEVSISQKPMVNAYDFKDVANYAFSVDANNRIMVAVKNVDGIAEGSYYLGKIKIGYNESWGYLCKALDSGGYCVGDNPTNLIKKYGWVNQTITYNNREGEWELKDTQGAELSMASGVLFFDGKVKLSQGYYANTVIATDDIEYGGSIKLQAPNYADASTVCNSTEFRRPTSLCSSANELKFESVGNIALLSGSCTDTASIDSCSTTYKGGDISLKAQATVEGSVIAGNKLETHGQSTVKGPVLAAALSTTKGTESVLRGSTTLDFDGVPTDGTTIVLPGSGGGTGGSGTTTQTSKIKWARYI